MGWSVTIRSTTTGSPGSGTSTSMEARHRPAAVSLWASLASRLVSGGHETLRCHSEDSAGAVETDPPYRGQPGDRTLGPPDVLAEFGVC